MKGRKPKSELKTDNTHYTKAQLEARSRAKSSHKQVPDGLSCPKVLVDPIAKAEWKRIMPLYRKMDIDVLNDLDVPTLIAYCMAYALYIHAVEEWNADPRIKIEVYNDKGQVVKVQQNPVLKTFNEQGTLIAKYAEVLCLSPVGRLRMGKVPPKKKEEPKHGFDSLYDDEDDEIPVNKQDA